jgi:hypothetical protein
VPPEHATHLGLEAHLVHLLPFLLVAAVCGTRLPTWLRHGDPTRRLGDLLAALLAAAAVVHALAAQDHRAEGTAVVAFFLAVGTLQLVLAAAVLRHPSRVVLVPAVLSSAGLIGLWWWSRTLGVWPSGVEAIGWADLLCSAAEGGTIAVAASLLRRECSPARLQWEQLAWGLIVVAGVGMLVRG